MLSEKLRAALDNLLPDAGEDEGYLFDGPPTLRDAAVLIAFTDRADPGVILTQRPQWLRSHAGQVAFPGGKIDPGDRDAIDAALREAEEEIGLHRRDVAIAAPQPDCRSQFRGEEVELRLDVSGTGQIMKAVVCSANILSLRAEKDSSTSST